MFSFAKTSILCTNSLVIREIIIVVSSLLVFIFFFFLSHMHIFGYVDKVVFGVEIIFARAEER